MRNQIKKAWNSISFAHAGEMLTRRDKHRLLDSYYERNPHHHPLPDHTHRGSITVSLGESASKQVLIYAINACQRQKSDLTLLVHGDDSRAEAALFEASSRLRDAAIHYHVVRLNGDWNHAVSHYVRTHENIQFLVLDAQDRKSQALLTQHRAFRRQHLTVPVVLVDSNSKPDLYAV